ncbi:MAG: DUF5675 family protein [Chitinophagaceae bacterium]
MELVLLRNYCTNGTNGNLYFNGDGLCQTIELPWKNNERKVSCIPEGRYELIKRYSPKYKWHLQVCNVPNRDLILIHPFNDAQKESMGCIAPVTSIIGEGKGNKSRIVFDKLKAFVYPVLERNEKVFLVIKSS